MGDTHLWVKLTNLSHRPFLSSKRLCSPHPAPSSLRRMVTMYHNVSNLLWLQAPPTNLFRQISLGDGLYVCGDHRCAATLDGALKSGRLAAEAVLAGLGSK